MKYVVEVDYTGDVYINGQFASQLCFDPESIGYALANYINEHDDDEDEDEEEKDYDIALGEDDYELDEDTGDIKIDKHAFDEFKKDQLVVIKFTDEDTTSTYTMSYQDSHYIYCEFYG